jgi:hypothetical protein
VPRVGQRVRRRYQRVEGDPPVREHGEVGEGGARRGAPAGGGVGALVADVEEEGREGVDGLYRRERKQKELVGFWVRAFLLLLLFFPFHFL